MAMTSDPLTEEILTRDIDEEQLRRALTQHAMSCAVGDEGCPPEEEEPPPLATPAAMAGSAG